MRSNILIWFARPIDQSFIILLRGRPQHIVHAALLQPPYQSHLFLTSPIPHHPTSPSPSQIHSLPNQPHQNHRLKPRVKPQNPQIQLHGSSAHLHTPPHPPQPSPHKSPSSPKSFRAAARPSPSADLARRSHFRLDSRAWVDGFSCGGVSRARDMDITWED